jgi:hypothetical protein
MDKRAEDSGMKTLKAPGAGHSKARKGAHGGANVDRRQKRIRKTAEASRRRNRR